MVDKFVTEQKRAQEYSILTTHIVKTLQDRLKQKGLDQDSGKINPANPDSHYFRVFSDHKTGTMTFEVGFVGDFDEEEMRYVFKDGRVKKEGHVYIDDHSVLQGETYYGEYTGEEKDIILDKNHGLSRDDVFFADPLRVELEELKMVSQIIDLLEINPNTADEIACKIPWFK